MQPVQPIQPIQPIQHIDRQSAIDILTADYNNELYEIQKAYDTSKKILDDNYNLTIKQINAMYDAYEVTLWQLAEYKTELLRSKLLELPNFTNFKLNTTLYKNCDIEFTHLSIKLNVTMLELEDSVFTICKYNLAKHKDVLFILTIKVNNANHASEILLNNISLYSLDAQVIKEKDIIVLWIYNELKLGININFIKISTGKLIYSEFYSTQYRHVRFMYCNNKVIKICEMSNILCITPYEITTLDTMTDIQLGPRNIVSLYVEGLLKLRVNIETLYSDSRGLYIYTNNCIYYIGDLCELPNKIIMLDLRYKFMLPSDKFRKHVTITSIDYDTYKIYIAIKENGDNCNYTLELGFTDACKLLY